MNPPQKPLVIVTGSSGLIGNAVCRSLAERYRIVGLDIAEPRERLDGVEWVECDFTDDSSVRTALAEIRQSAGDRVASVIHLAAYYDFAGEPSRLYEQLTVEGTRRLLLALQEFDRVEQFLFSSSLLVMKPCELGEKLTEQSPTRAEWDYPESKLQAEQVIRQQRGQIPALILRLAGIYDEMGHSPPITQNIRRIAEKQLESYLFPGDAERGQSFLHLEDAVNCIEQAVNKRGQLAGEQVLLVGEEECLSYENLQDRIGALLHGDDDWPTIRIPKFVAKAGAWAKDKLAGEDEEKPFIKPWMVDLADAHYPVDPSKAAELLQWRPQHRLSTTLPEMIHRLKENPLAWYEENDLPLPERATLDELASDSRSFTA